jgi:hypothetical protein
MAGCAGVLLASLACPHAAASQLPTRDNYEHFLPAVPPIVAQTDATVRFRLYGDPADPTYSDTLPIDGIDDGRAGRLLALAERFSPILRRNTQMVPREFEATLGDRVEIQVDSWREGERIASDRIDLGPPSTGTAATGAAPDDDRLLALLRARLPDRVHAHVAQPRSSVDTVLYFDVPGDDEFTWRPAHQKDRASPSRIYVHPFVYETADSSLARRFELLLQYWFYYPYNDGANNHEGDWEHLTVSVTTERHAREDRELARAERGLLDSTDVEAIVGSDAAAVPVDSLTVRAVTYYFHNNALVVDYLGIAAGETMWRRARNNDGSVRIWEDTRYMDQAVRGRMTVGEARLATHPLGYVGGNNKGWDEVIQLWPRFYRSYNRDSHGTYPFPGVWREVGPVDATEKVHGDPVPRLRRDANGEPELWRPWYELIQDPRYQTYRADDMVLLPDWERLEPLVLADPVARRRWAWFLLPAHMGFPATRSPGAGALPHVDMGNVAPMSPPHNSAWNRPAATGTYALYEPTVLRVAAAPISPASMLQSGWGVFNLPIVVAGLLPGANVAITQLLPWITGAMHVMGAPPAKTFYLGDLPTRFTSVGAGGFHQFGGTAFARLLPGTEDPGVAEFLAAHAAEGAQMGKPQRLPEWGSRAWFNLYYGPRLSMENSFAYSVARVSYPITTESGDPLAAVSGRLYTRELTGGITYRIPPTLSDVVRLYGRAGYGWTSTSLGNAALDGRPLPNTSVDAGYLPKLLPSRTWWPNTAYAGLGVELFTPPKYWLLKRLGYGVRLEATGLSHRLNATWECEACHVTANRGDVAMTVVFGW